MMKVKFLRRWRGREPGDIAEFADGLATTMIQSHVAAPVADPSEKPQRSESFRPANKAVKRGVVSPK
jgi:hypothetical protein